MPLSDRQTSFLAEYHKSPRGTSVSEFVRQRGTPAYSTVMGWSKVEPEFKRRLQAIHREKYADVKVKRKIPPLAVAVADAPAQGDLVGNLAGEAAAVAEAIGETPHEAVAAPLTPAQEAWLLAYTSNGFQVLAACQAAQMGYDEFEALVRANGSFSERYRAAERQMKQALRDKYLATALAPTDFDRVAVKELLKVYDDTFNKTTSGTDSGAQNIWTIGLAMAGRKKVWADIFPGMDRRLPQ